MSVTPAPDGSPSQSIGDRRVRIFPTNDAAFRTAVFGYLAALDGMNGHLGDELELALRREFPAVRVIGQARLAALADEPCIYVFRDGSLRPQRADRQESQATSTQW